MNVGMLGAGGIAISMAKTIEKIPSSVNYAIASRSLEKAQAFQREHGFAKAYGSYEELVRDPAVDLVYIATPHSEHFKNMELCLRYHKPVLCEKAFTANEVQAKTILSAFEKEKVFVTEAIWTRYLPARKILADLLSTEVIGKPYLLEANLCYPNKNHARLTDPSLAGGALLDMGIYPLNFALMVFGDQVEKVYASCKYTDTGVDEATTMIVDFTQGRKAVLFTSMDGPSDRSGYLYGSKGYLQVININNTERIDVFNADHQRANSIEIPRGISGYEWEVYATMEALKNHALECPEMSHKETIFVMSLMDEMRRQMGIIYPFEK